VKNQDDIQRRLQKLRRRYAQKYINSSQDRKPCNCEHNYVDSGERSSRAMKLSLGPKVETEEEWSPRVQRTLMVIQDPKPIRLCTYGSDNPEKWNGIICDTDDVARACPYFNPSVDRKAAQDEFMDKLADDEFVFDNYRDMATLQWVLGERIHDRGLSWWDKLVFWISDKFSRSVRPVRWRRAALKNGDHTEKLLNSNVPPDFWDD